MKRTNENKPLASHTHSLHIHTAFTYNFTRYSFDMTLLNELHQTSADIRMATYPSFNASTH